MDVLALLAILAFIVAAVFGFVKREFTVAIIATGLALLTWSLTWSGSLQIGK